MDMNKYAKEKDGTLKLKDGRPIVTHVKVLRAGPKQKISSRFVSEQAAVGILSIGDGKISLKTADGDPDLVYTIERGPGYYCCHCWLKVADAWEALTHIAAEHADMPEIAAALISRDRTAAFKEIGYEVHGDSLKESDVALVLSEAVKSPERNYPAGCLKAEYYLCSKED